MRTVLVVGRDWKFRALLRAQLQDEGFDALGFETLEPAADEIAHAAAAALVFDTTDAPAAELAQLRALSEKLPLLVVASAGESLPVSEDCVLRRPLQLSQVVSALKNRLR